MKLIARIAATNYVRSAIEDKADLSPFKQKPTVRIITGVLAIGFSFVICWPAISALGTLSIYLNEPLLIVIGGPVLYGLSHLVYLAGMYLAGEKYTKIFLRWLTRVTMEKLIGAGF
ncbi:MAG: hypothetical protein Q8P24_07265 [Desulfobacterales bacterium]|nr:hypothetical protein [Desulfobacterales bacterium]